jgi:hypothetical protein
MVACKRSRGTAFTYDSARISYVPCDKTAANEDGGGGGAPVVIVGYSVLLEVCLIGF